MKTGTNRVKASAYVLSILIGLLIIAELLIAQSQKRATDFDIGDFSGYKVEETERAYIQSPTNENLLLLLKVLCYESEVEDNKAVGSRIKQYGDELYRRAKADEIDLSTADDEAAMLAVIQTLKKYNAS